MFAPNLAWRDVDLKARARGAGRPARSWSRTTPTPRPGASSASAPAHDVDDLLLVTVGTGVGGGLVLDGELYRGAFGVGAEIGHMRVVPGRHPLRLRQPRLPRAVRQRLRAGARGPRRGAAPARCSPAGCSTGPAATSTAITGPLITEAARDGDPFAVEQLAELGRWLGEGIASLTAVLDPAVVVIGGGVSEAGDLLLDPIRAAFAGAAVGPRAPAVLEIRKARSATAPA